MVPGRERYSEGEDWERSRLGRGMIEKRKAWERRVFEGEMRW